MIREKYYELNENEILVPAHKVYLENGSVIVPSGISENAIFGNTVPFFLILRKFWFYMILNFHNFLLFCYTLVS